MSLIKIKVRESKAAGKDIAIIGYTMIKYMNRLEVSQPILGKIRSNRDGTSENLIDYVRPTAYEKNKNDS